MSKTTILIIDDTPINLFTLSSALSKDFEIQVATSGEVGIELAIKYHPDLILLDIMMPEMDGYETCARLKDHPYCSDIPIIFITALTESDSEIRGLALGAADYITKPINIEVAKHRIYNLLLREKLRAEVAGQRDQLTEKIHLLHTSYVQLKLAASVFSNVKDGIIIADEKGYIVDVNEAFTTITGYSKEDALGNDTRLLKGEKNADEFYTDMWSTLSTTGYWRGEMWNKTKNGEVYAELLTVSAVYNEDNKVTNYIALFSDITERKRLEDQINHLAYYDPLTNLPNRRLLNDRMLQALAESKRNKNYGALLYLDLDNFKPLNDTYGHAIGDLLLVEVAARLKKCVREVDTVARLGGDEFVVVTRDLDPDPAIAHDKASIVAEKIRTAIAVTYNLNIDPPDPLIEASKMVLHQCTATIGVALFVGPLNTPEAILKAADAAMYSAKESGRNVIMFETPKTI